MAEFQKEFLNNLSCAFCAGVVIPTKAFEAVCCSGLLPGKHLSPCVVHHGLLPANHLQPFVVLVVFRQSESKLERLFTNTYTDAVVREHCLGTA